VSQFGRIPSSVAAIILAASFSGCGTGDVTGGTSTSMNPDQVTEIEKALRAKPALEAVQAEYKAAVTTMADRIAALIPGTTWQFAQDTWTACGGKYSATKAKQAYVLAAFNGPIPDTVWPKALQIAKDGAARFGATDYGTFKDQPGNHDIYIAGSDGVEFRLGTQGASTLMGQSDCRLSEADKGLG
jgi:hypothetical protein